MAKQRRRPVAAIGVEDDERPGPSGGGRTALWLALLGMGSAVFGAVFIGPRLGMILDQRDRPTATKARPSPGPAPVRAQRSAKSQGPLLSRHVDIKPAEGPSAGEKGRQDSAEPQPGPEPEPGLAESPRQPGANSPGSGGNAARPLPGVAPPANVTGPGAANAPGGAPPAAPTGRLYRVRVGPFGTRTDAEQVRNRLVEAGFAPLPVIVASGPSYAIQVGAYRDSQNASTMADRLRAQSLEPKVLEPEP